MTKNKNLSFRSQLSTKQHQVKVPNNFLLHTLGFHLQIQMLEPSHIMLNNEWTNCRISSTELLKI